MSAPFSIIMADPAWQYRDKANDGQRGASHKYDCMTLKEIIDLKPGIDRIAAPDCALFLWATGPMMREAFHVGFKWGFKFRTYAFVWIKTTRKSTVANLETDPVKLFFGMGNWTRSNAEFCLLFTRGKMKRVDASVRQVILSPVRGHSQKPDETRDRIVKLMGDLPRVELFARNTTPGWDVWGNQVKSTIQLL